MCSVLLNCSTMYEPYITINKYTIRLRGKRCNLRSKAHVWYMQSLGFHTQWCHCFSTFHSPIALSVPPWDIVTWYDLVMAPWTSQVEWLSEVYKIMTSQMSLKLNISVWLCFSLHGLLLCFIWSLQSSLKIIKHHIIRIKI